MEIVFTLPVLLSSAYRAHGRLPDRERRRGCLRTGGDPHQAIPSSRETTTKKRTLSLHPPFSAFPVARN